MSALERVALLGLGATIALGIDRWLWRFGRTSCTGDPAAATSGPQIMQSLELHVTAMDADDAAGVAFVLCGYAAVAVAEGKVATEEELRDVRQALAALYSDAGGAVLLCHCEDRIVGYLWYITAAACPWGPPGCYGPEEADLDGTHEYFWVHTVFTDKAMRRRGVARALYAHLETVARGRGISSIWCDVFDSNPGSTALHRQQLGFEPVTMIHKKEVC